MRWTWIGALCSGCLLGVELPLPGDTDPGPPIETDEDVPGDEDLDEDGFSEAEGDCDDHNAARAPDKEEVVVDGIDQDCDGNDLCYADVDGDQWGAADAFAAVPVGQGCVDAERAAANPLDCDDTNAEVSPTSTEQEGDGVDSDCDGKEMCYVDGDLDGYGGSGTVRVVGLVCATSSGHASQTGDCADADPAVHPGVRELPNSIDDDCDELVDEDILDLCLRRENLQSIALLTVQEPDGAGGWQPAFEWNAADQAWEAPDGAHELRSTVVGLSCTRVGVQQGSELRVEGRFLGEEIALARRDLMYLDQCITPVMQVDLWMRPWFGGEASLVQTSVDVRWDSSGTWCDTDDLYGVIEVPCFVGDCACDEVDPVLACAGHELATVDDCGVVQSVELCTDARATCAELGADPTCEIDLSEGMRCESPLTTSLLQALGLMNSIPDALRCGGVSCSDGGSLIANPSGPVWFDHSSGASMGSLMARSLQGAGTFRCFREVGAGGTDDAVDDDLDCYCEHGTVCAAATARCPLGVLPGDCDDGDETVNPGETERTTNLYDDDCDGEIDE
jgi:hypothetical protein